MRETTVKMMCLAMNQDGETCQLLRGHVGWHEYEDKENHRKTSWNYSDPSLRIADSELWRLSGRSK